MSDLETQIAADYGVVVDVSGTEADEPWNTERGGIDAINAVSEGVGQVVAWLALLLVFNSAAAVIMREGFNKPLAWANDMGYFLYAIHFLLGTAFTLKRNGHIRTDFIYRNWSAKRQGLTDAIVYGVLFIPCLLFALNTTTRKGISSARIQEKSITSNSDLPLWVLKLVLPAAILLWLLQSISEWVKSVRVAKTGEWQ